MFKTARRGIQNGESNSRIASGNQIIPVKTYTRDRREARISQKCPGE